jgi:hypothetical protein
MAITGRNLPPSKRGADPRKDDASEADGRGWQNAF